MGDQEQGMEKVSGGGDGRRKKGLSIPAKGGCGAGVGVGVGVSVGVAILVFSTAVGAIVRARRARHEDRTTKRSFGEDEDNKRIEGEGKEKEKEKEVDEEEEDASIISQRREEMSEEIEKTSFQIDQENQYFCGKLDLNPKGENTKIVTIEEEEIILKASTDGDCDHENSEESKVIPTEVKVFEEANKEEEEEEQEEDSGENEKADCEATIESSIKETVDGSNDDSRASLTESGVFEAVVEAIERENEEENEEIEKRIANTSETENDLLGNKREVEWKLEDDVNKVSREEPKEIEVSNTTKTIVMMHENAIGFAITNRTKGGLLMISAFVLTIVLLLFVRRDRLGVSQLTTM